MGDIFGDISEEEAVTVEEVIVRRRPMPDKKRTFSTLKLPNIMSIERNSFNPKAFNQAARVGYKDFNTTQNARAVKLLNPENCFRWRFKKWPAGNILTDSDGRPQYESNARLVEWEDGSKTIHIGEEAFIVSEQSIQNNLFEENSHDLHVFHGPVTKRLICTPKNLDTTSHEMLKRSQYSKYAPTSRTLLITPEEQVESKQMYELEMEQRKRQAMKERRRLEPGAEAEITAAFLEDDPPRGIGPSALDIKNQFKKTDALKKRKF